jgi:hypothetical protein
MTRRFLLEPDVRISRIRLPDWLHREARGTNHIEPGVRISRIRLFDWLRLRGSSRHRLRRHRRRRGSIRGLRSGSHGGRCVCNKGDRLWDTSWYVAVICLNSCSRRSIKTLLRGGGLTIAIHLASCVDRTRCNAIRRCDVRRRNRVHSRPLDGYGRSNYRAACRLRRRERECAARVGIVVGDEQRDTAHAGNRSEQHEREGEAELAAKVRVGTKILSFPAAWKDGQDDHLGWLTVPRTATGSLDWAAMTLRTWAGLPTRY